MVQKAGNRQMLEHLHRLLGLKKYIVQQLNSHLMQEHTAFKMRKQSTHLQNIERILYLNQMTSTSLMIFLEVVKKRKKEMKE